VHDNDMILNKVFDLIFYFNLYFDFDFDFDFERNK
jgi:hypothetical protein